MDSNQWYRRHTRDSYVHKAQNEGYRSRAAYKLIEIDTKHQLFANVGVVLDLGAAPGSWSQVATRHCHKNTNIIAVDCLPMKPIEGVNIVQGDFLEQNIREQLHTLLSGRKADLILSDMSPNLSGIATVDQLKAAALIELAIAMCQQWLQPQGSFVAKIFHGSEFQQMVKSLGAQFAQVKIIKPQASRSGSKEVYLYAKQLVSGSK